MVLSGDRLSKPEPFYLLRRDARIGDPEVLPPIRHAVAAKARIEDNEVVATEVKGVERPFPPDNAQELRLGQVVNAMVSEDIVVLGVDGGELLKCVSSSA